MELEPPPELPPPNALEPLIPPETRNDEVIDNSLSRTPPQQVGGEEPIVLCKNEGMPAEFNPTPDPDVEDKLKPICDMVIIGKRFNTGITVASAIALCMLCAINSATHMRRHFDYALEHNLLQQIEIKSQNLK
eukprot:gene11648-24392_t